MCENFWYWRIVRDGSRREDLEQIVGFLELATKWNNGEPRRMTEQGGNVGWTRGDVHQRVRLEGSCRNLVVVR